MAYVTVGTPREVARAAQAGREELYATLHPQNISQLSCGIGERHRTEMTYVRQKYCSVSVVRMRMVTLPSARIYFAPSLSVPIITVYCCMRGRSACRLCHADIASFHAEYRSNGHLDFKIIFLLFFAVQNSENRKWPLIRPTHIPCNFMVVSGHFHMIVWREDALNYLYTCIARD
jgi:hypothetical protein